ICILTKNVITSCSVTMMLFLHLEVKPLMTLTTVLYLSCALISGHLAMMLMDIQTACLIMEGAEFTENIINGVERPVNAAELFAFTLRVRAGNTDVLTDAEENVRQKL